MTRDADRSTGDILALIADTFLGACMAAFAAFGAYQLVTHPAWHWAVVFAVNAWWTLLCAIRYAKKI